MLKFSRPALLLLAVLAVTSCKTATLSTPAPVKVTSKTNILSKAELNTATKIVSSNKPKKYEYRLLKLKKQSNGKYLWTPTAKSNFQGLIYMRNKEEFSALGGSYYDDGLGNLLRFEKGSGYDLAITYKFDGENIVAIDANRDHVIDAAMGHIDRNNLWILGDNLRELLPCLGSSSDNVYDAFLNCAGGIEQPNSPTTGSPSGGSNNDVNDLNVGLLGDPNCPPETGGGGVISGGGGTAPGEDRAPPAPPPSTKSPDDEDYPPMGRHESYSTEEDGRQARVVTVRTADRMVEQTTGTEPDGSIIRTTIHRDAQGRETYREDVLVGPGPDRRLLMHRVTRTSYDSDGNATTVTDVSRQARNHSALEPVNPDGSTIFKDPRCAGRDTRNSQGLGFLDMCKKYGSTDFLTCFRKLESPLYNMTGGRCRIVKGPSDANVLQCSDDQSILECISGGGSPEECGNNGTYSEDLLGPGGSNAGPVDGPGIPSNVGVLDTKYIDTIPLGAIIAGICAQGGCPDPRPF